MPTYSQEWDPGDYRANNEQRGRMGFGGTEHGGEQYASRSRMLGSEAQQRGAYQSDFGQSNESRGLGMDARNDQNRAAGLIESAANGQQPSAAEVLARRNNEAAIRAGTSMAAGVKGGAGARVAAMRNAQRMGSQQMAQGAQQAEQLRAQEMEAARGQLMGARTAIRQGDTAQRGQDLGAAQIQQQNELTQRGMNDAQQRFFEQQGTGIQTQDQNNQLAQQGLATGAWQAGRASTQEDEKFDFGKTMTYAKGIAGAASGAASGAADSLSDERAKNVIPFGSLAPMSVGAAPASANALSGSGGMDVMGSIKANSDFATKYQRDPTGGMTSDERAKNVMYSPAEIKDPVSAPSFMAAEGERREDAMPYMRVADTGVAGAPRGYAAFRDGHAGSMFGNSPDVSSGYEKQEAKTGAPGTEDFQKYGEPAKRDGEVDWKHGGTTTEKGKKPNAILGSLAGFLGGLSGRSSAGSRDLTYSDDKTKLKEAFEHGAKYADAAHAGVTIPAPDYATGKAEKPRNPNLGPVPDPKTEMAHLQRMEQIRGESVSQPAPVVVGDPARGRLQTAADKAAPYAVGPVAATAAKKVMRSDEKTKRVVDLKDDVTMTDPKDEPAFQAWKKKYAHPQDNGEDYDLRGAWKAGVKPGPDGHWPDTFKRPNHPTFSDESKYAGNEGAKPGHWNGDTFVPNIESGSDRSRMRDGSSDARTNSFDKTFRRDTKADQARVKRGVEDKAGRDADAMMAGFGASLAKGPTARVEDIDGDQKPDLASAAKEKADAGHIPEHAMFRAMKAMEPSLYSYKPEYTPPEQHVGEVQAGPMANNMERDPIAGTAIVKDPGTGLLAIDKDKALKLTMGSLAVLAQDVEQMKRKKKGAK